ncbi:MAG: phage holin family protein [Mycobacteriales bacterium]
MSSDLTTSEPSLGELVASATRDLSTLMRKEVELAKLEIKRDVVSAGKGAGLLGGAGFIVLLSVIFFGIAAAYGLEALGLGLGWGFLIVAGGYLVVAGALALLGKRNLGKVGPPTQTITTLRDDASWAKHPINPPKASTAAPS